MSNQKNTSFVKIVLVLSLICAAISSLVAGVNALTKEQIAKNTEAKIENALKEIFPVYSSKTTLTSEQFAKEINAVYKINGDDGDLGYAIDITAKGYGSDGINMMVGVNGGKVISVVIVSASGETPGLGQNVTKPDYLAQYIGIAKDQKADAITGATVSSNAVQAGVTTALETADSISAGLITVKEAQ